MIISEHAGWFQYQILLIDTEVALLAKQDLLFDPPGFSKPFELWLNTITNSWPQDSVSFWTREWIRNWSDNKYPWSLRLFFRNPEPVMIFKLKYGNLLTDP